MRHCNPREMNTTALAYIGDAVYEIYVREHVLAASGQPGSTPAQAGMPAAKGRTVFGAHVDALHKRAVRYVRADGQAKALRAMMRDGFLSEAEEALVRRARNHKSASKPKNADAMDYKYATALEALIGYWYLCAHADADEDNAARTRMEEIIFHAFALIEK